MRAARLNETQVVAAWDTMVPSPSLPVRLGPLMAAAGFSAVRVEAFPIVNTSYAAGSWSVDMLQH